MLLMFCKRIEWTSGRLSLPISRVLFPASDNCEMMFFRRSIPPSDIWTSVFRPPSSALCLPTSRLTRNQKVAYYHAVIDAVFKALADPSRRKLLDRLHKSDGRTLTELCERLDMSRQAVTKHLLLLEKANLVSVVWRGREKLHYLNPVPLHEIYERWIGKYEGHRLQGVERS